ncbi:MAG: serine hydrolase, partial [bacterium]
MSKNPGYAFKIIQNKIELVSKCSGFANLETEDKIQLTSNFRLASISKTFTAMAILILVDKNLLTL